MADDRNVLVKTHILFYFPILGDKRSMNIIYSLILVSVHKICTEEKVLVLNLDSKLVCVDWRWIYSLLWFQKKSVYPRETSTSTDNVF